jgi:hypothetical protein
MSNDVERMFAALSDGAGRARFAPPAAVRRRADRRLAARSVATVAAAAILVVGVAVGGRFVLADGGRSPVTPAESAAPSAPPSPSAPGSSSAPPPPTTTSPSIPSSIPNRAFLSAADVRGIIAPERRSGQEMLPKLCGADYASGMIGVRSTRYVPYLRQGAKKDETFAGTVDQAVTVYKGNGAQAFLDEVRDAVRDCRRDTHRGSTCTHRLLAAQDVGDEALLIEVATPARGDSGELETDGSLRRDYCAVVRDGEAVTVLWVQGWESQSAEKADADAFTRRAAQRLADWRG